MEGDHYLRFTEYVEYKLYCEAVELLHDNYDQLNEFKIPSFLSKYIDFMKSLIDSLKISKENIVEFFKNKGIFKFFSKFKFSLSKIWDFVKNGFEYYRMIQRAIADYIRQVPGVKWTEDRIKDLDAFLNKHPKLKKIGGYALGATLVYIWLNMTFTGDFDFDFDQTTLLAAIAGTVGFADVFTGTEGIRLLTLFITGQFLSFPWPGASSVLFIGSLVYTLAKIYKVKMEQSKEFKNK
jgi:hypothetical protein